MKTASRLTQINRLPILARDGSPAYLYEREFFDDRRRSHSLRYCFLTCPPDACWYNSWEDGDLATLHCMDAASLTFYTNMGCEDTALSSVQGAYVQGPVASSLSNAAKAAGAAFK
jgi:hypothetical protein